MLPQFFHHDAKIDIGYVLVGVISGGRVVFLVLHVKYAHLAQIIKQF